jgi:hypothetical protein
MSTQKQGDAASPPEQIRGWLTGRLPGDWFEGAPEILIDREEITVIGHLLSPGTSAAAGGGKGAQAKVADAARERGSGPGPRPRRPPSVAAAGSVRRPATSG